VRSDLRGRAALAAAAAVPFVPALAVFVRLGVPDYLFSGDGATLELRVLHASRGAQLLGPYSRFFWSHPGPAFFYLALPIYELFGERGPALNLFMLLLNLAVAIGIVLSARRIAGDAFAWLTAALLAAFELVALPFLQTGEWNPVSPILPLVLLSFLTARLALGAVGVLPVFAFVASAIVQTHIGFAPAVAALCALAAAGLTIGWLQGTVAVVFARRERLIVAATAAALIACWILPLYESAFHRPGNIAQLMAFFSAPAPVEHPWDAVFSTVFTHVSVMPISLVRSVHVDVATPGPMLAEAIALGACGFVLTAIVHAWRTRDSALGVIAAIALALVAVAVAAMRSVRGDLLPYLAFWIAVPGLMAVLTGAAWIARHLERRRGVAIAIAAASIVLTLTAQPIQPPFREPDIAIDRIAGDTAQYVRAQRLDRPVVRIVSGNAWPTAAAIVLHLRKEHIPIAVENAWIFMFGTPFAPDAYPHATILVANRAFDRDARQEPQLTRVASNGDTTVYVEPPRFLESHRLAPPQLRASIGIDRDPRLAVDGDIPPDGAPWNGPASAIFKSTASAITVEVPRGAAGLFASVDGNDLYALRCVDGSQSWTIGVRNPSDGVVGLHTRMLYDDAIAQCAAIEIRPESGDDLYSIGEIGFLRR
jgi:hypothetical protein